MKVYKVVSSTRSSVHARCDYEVTYPVGEAVLRDHLFVFLRKEDAEEMLDNLSNREVEVWECETQSVPVPAPNLIPDYAYTGFVGFESEWMHTKIDEFWKDQNSWDLNMLAPSSGSYLVDDVKLVRRVY